jgi:hypothetical protein
MRSLLFSVRLCRLQPQMYIFKGSVNIFPGQRIPRRQKYCWVGCFLRGPRRLISSARSEKKAGPSVEAGYNNSTIALREVRGVRKGTQSQMIV